MSGLTGKLPWARRSALGVGGLGLASLWLWFIPSSVFGSGEPWENLVPQYVGTGVGAIDLILTPIVIGAPLIGVAMFLAALLRRTPSRVELACLGLYAASFLTCYGGFVRARWRAYPVGGFVIWAPDTARITKELPGNEGQWLLNILGNKGFLVHVSTGGGGAVALHRPAGATIDTYRNHFGLLVNRAEWSTGDGLHSGESRFASDQYGAEASSLHLWYEHIDGPGVGLIRDISLLVQLAKPEFVFQDSL